jgi:hypothetical protein
MYSFLVFWYVIWKESEGREGKWEMGIGEDMRVWGDGWKGKGKGLVGGKGREGKFGEVVSDERMDERWKSLGRRREEERKGN